MTYLLRVDCERIVSASLIKSIYSYLAFTERVMVIQGGKTRYLIMAGFPTMNV